jgi:hypothetical protein
VIALSATTPAIGASSAYAQDACPFPAAQALDEAQALLRQDHPDDDDLKTAMACLAQVVADTRDELEALRDGRLAFTGQIHIPKGWTITKPPASEAD